MDSDPNADINPTLTTIGVTQNWCIWQSNRGGYWDIYASYIYATGVEIAGSPSFCGLTLGKKDLGCWGAGTLVLYDYDATEHGLTINTSTACSADKILNIDCAAITTNDYIVVSDISERLTSAVMQKGTYDTAADGTVDNAAAVEGVDLGTMTTARSSRSRVRTMPT